MTKSLEGELPGGHRESPEVLESPGLEVLSPNKLWGSSSSPGSRVWSPLHCELQEGGCNREPKATVGEVIGWPQVIPRVIGPTRSCTRPGKASKPGLQGR